MGDTFRSRNFHFIRKGSEKVMLHVFASGLLTVAPHGGGVAVLLYEDAALHPQPVHTQPTALRSAQLYPNAPK